MRCGHQFTTVFSPNPYPNQTQAFTGYGRHPAQMDEPAGMSIAALVLGILSILFICVWFVAVPCAVLAIVLGVISMNNGQRGRGMSIAGIVCAGFSLAVTLLFVILWAAISPVPTSHHSSNPEFERMLKRLDEKERTSGSN